MRSCLRLRTWRVCWSLENPMVIIAILVFLSLIDTHRIAWAYYYALVAAFRCFGNRSFLQASQKPSPPTTWADFGPLKWHCLMIIGLGGAVALGTLDPPRPPPFSFSGWRSHPSSSTSVIILSCSLLGCCFSLHLFQMCFALPINIVGPYSPTSPYSYSYWLLNRNSAQTAPCDFWFSCVYVAGALPGRPHTDCQLIEICFGILIGPSLIIASWRPAPAALWVSPHPRASSGSFEDFRSHLGTRRSAQTLSHVRVGSWIQSCPCGNFACPTARRCRTGCFHTFCCLCTRAPCNQNFDLYQIIMF